MKSHLCLFPKWKAVRRKQANVFLATLGYVIWNVLTLMWPVSGTQRRV